MLVKHERIRECLCWPERLRFTFKPWFTLWIIRVFWIASVSSEYLQSIFYTGHIAAESASKSDRQIVQAYVKRGTWVENIEPLNWMLHFYCFHCLAATADSLGKSRESYFAWQHCGKCVTLLFCCCCYMQEKSPKIGSSVCFASAPHHNIQNMITHNCLLAAKCVLDSLAKTIILLGQTALSTVLSLWILE